MVIKLNIGKNIKKLRKSQGITQKELATFLGYKKNIIAEWESGKKLPPTDKLPFLTGILKCGYSDLFREKSVHIPSESLNEYAEDWEKIWSDPKNLEDTDYIIHSLKSLIEYNRKFKDIHITEYHREWQNLFFKALIKYFTSLKCQDEPHSD